MAVTMRLFLPIFEPLRSFCLNRGCPKPHIGFWLMGLCIAVPATGVSLQSQPRLLQGASPYQQKQAENRTAKEAQLIGGRPFPVANPLFPVRTQHAADQPGPAVEQEQAETGSHQSQSSEPGASDEILAKIRAALQSVSSPDLGALGQAFDTTVRKPDEASSDASLVQLIELGDLHGDGVPEIALTVLASEPSQEDAQAEPPPAPWRGLYLLSWDGTRWQASSLATSGQVFQFHVVRLGKSTGRCIAVVNVIGEDALPFPTIFQVREHQAALLWDSQAGENRYNALAHGRIEFLDNAKLEQTDMIVTGRADPGLLEFEPNGHRGFNARCAYHWDGEAYVPGRTEYSPGPDNTLYRFIAALHLHDFRGAYALTDPVKFLKTDAPSLGQFRQMVEAHWPEFLDDQVFHAREARAGSADDFAFELPSKHYVYVPTLSGDGKFLLTGLERKVEMPGTEPAGDSP
jgi:hypothetical protein